MEIFKVKQGDDFRVSLNFTDSDGAAVDVSAQTLVIAIKANRNDTDADAVYLNSFTPTQTDPVNGVVRWDVADTITKLWPLGNLLLQFRLIDNSTTLLSSTDIIRVVVEENVIDSL